MWILQGIVQVGPDGVSNEVGMPELTVGSNIGTAKDILGMAMGLSTQMGTADLPQTIGFQTAYAASMHVYKMIGDGISVVKVN